MCPRASALCVGVLSVGGEAGGEAGPQATANSQAPRGRAAGLGAGAGTGPTRGPRAGLFREVRKATGRHCQCPRGGVLSCPPAPQPLLLCCCAGRLSQSAMPPLPPRPPRPAPRAPLRPPMGMSLRKWMNPARPGHGVGRCVVRRQRELVKAWPEGPEGPSQVVELLA